MTEYVDILYPGNGVITIDVTATEDSGLFRSQDAPFETGGDVIEAVQDNIRNADSMLDTGGCMILVTREGIGYRFRRKG